MNITRALQAVGVAFALVLVAVAGVLIVDTEIAGLLPFGLNLVEFIGGAMIVMGLYFVRVRYQSSLHDTETPDPEFPLSVPTPGDDFDDMVTSLVNEARGNIELRESINERLETAAVSVLMYQEDLAYEEAIEQVNEGEWTDNPLAEAFFTGSLSGVSTGSHSVVTKVTSQILGESASDVTYTELVEATVNAIYNRCGLEAGVDPGEPASEESLVDRILGRVPGGSDGSESESRDVASYPSWYRETVTALSAGDREDVELVATNHWIGMSAFALLAAGIGIFTGQPGLLLAGGIPIAYATYSRVVSPPSVEGLQVERELSDENPAPGDEIQVTVKLQNDSDATIPDLRIIDLVPETMVVTRGSARFGTGLRPGHSASFSYSVVAERGDHNWPVQVISRDPSGTWEQVTAIKPHTEMVCRPLLATMIDAPVRTQTSQYSGEVSTGTGGPGIEFFAVREYRHGDPMKRVNWNRLAKTGELATVNYREEKAATLTLIFDTRQSSFLAPEPGSRHAIDKSVDAATEIFTSLQDNGHLVGLAAYDTIPCWLSPGAGSGHLEEARELFSTHPALSPLPPQYQNLSGGYVDPLYHVQRQLPHHSQAVIFSPLGDEYPYEVASRLDTNGHLVTIISPDPTATRTMGQRLTKVERFIRINRLRERGIRVIDWQYDDQLTVEIRREELRAQA